MKRVWLIVILLTSILWSCKEKPKIPESRMNEPVQESPKVERLSPIILELVQFSDTTLAEGAEVTQLFTFKKIDANGIVTEIEVDEAVILYKGLMTPKKSEASPIFEIKNTDIAILPISGKGFGGPIWAKLMVDRTTLGIKKIAFEHQAESEGYGSAMTQMSFENQFVGTKINLDQKTFALQKSMEKRIDDGTIIDGITGATMTNNGVIEMMNEGIKSYRKYLRP